MAVEVWYKVDPKDPLGVYHYVVFRESNDLVSCINSIIYTLEQGGGDRECIAGARLTNARTHEYMLWSPKDGCRGEYPFEYGSAW